MAGTSLIEEVARALASYQGVRYEGSLKETWDGMARAALQVTAADSNHGNGRVKSVTIGIPLAILPACESCGVIVSDIDSHWENAHQGGEL